MTFCSKSLNHAWETIFKVFELGKPCRVIAHNLKTILKISWQLLSIIVKRIRRRKEMKLRYPNSKQFEIFQNKWFPTGGNNLQHRTHAPKNHTYRTTAELSSINYGDIIIAKGNVLTSSDGFCPAFFFKSFKDNIFPVFTNRLRDAILVDLFSLRPQNCFRYIDLYIYGYMFMCITCIVSWVLRVRVNSPKFEKMNVVNRWTSIPNGARDSEGTNR